jgi:hypothetical protein
MTHGRKPVPPMSKVRVTDGCWEWQGARDRLGYGRTWWDGSTKYAHRVVYEMHCGPIPEGLFLDHLCRNPPCVNPAHLDPVTHQENIRRSPLVMQRPDVCKRGHALDYTGPDGRRGCRECRYESVRRWRSKTGAA